MNNFDNLFEIFAQSLENPLLQDYEQTARKISASIGKNYYGKLDNFDKFIHIVGSVGRGTSIKNVSDLDFLLVLPNTIQKRFDNYSVNGQSALLQEIKEQLKLTYPQTDIRGDGQVVVIDFKKYTVELVPVFLRDDNSFSYPDTHDGGSWKRTDPIKEIHACRNYNIETYGKYFGLCRIVRAWKQAQGFPIGGLLVDTLVHDFLKENNYSDSYQILIKNLFYYISQIDPDRQYWYAIGSNQQVYMPKKQSFINEAEKVYERLSSCRSEIDLYYVYKETFGRLFPVVDSYIAEIYLRKCSTESFIEDIRRVEIKYSLKIDCDVTCVKGYLKKHTLSGILKSRGFVRIGQKLDFYIAETDCPEPYTIWWKVRNIGLEAINRNNERGQIICTNRKNQHEEAVFSGNHYVECYLVNEKGICVARNRIDVPIHG